MNSVITMKKMKGRTKVEGEERGKEEKRANAGGGA